MNSVGCGLALTKGGDAESSYAKNSYVQVHGMKEGFYYYSTPNLLLGFTHGM